MTLAKATAALQRIDDEAEDYRRNPDRFRPMKGSASLEDIHIYREGVRDGRLQSARIARAALESLKESNETTR